MQENGVRDFK
uniref:Uncharacterized protein n=1 Tax=Anguilla anguilla TaxID=7936 RepID=A0A0E9URM6_ANGAN